MVPFKIDPEAIYSDGEVRLGLDLTGSAIATARRKKLLRFTRQGKRYLYRGQWILDWLDLTAAMVGEGVRHD